MNALWNLALRFQAAAQLHLCPTFQFLPKHQLVNQSLDATKEPLLVLQVLEPLRLNVAVSYLYG